MRVTVGENKLRSFVILMKTLGQTITKEVRNLLDNMGHVFRKFCKSSVVCLTFSAL